MDDGGAVQFVQMQLSQSETRDRTPRIAEYGYSSNPPDGADAVAVFLGGDRTNGVVIACGHQAYRMRGLASGEVAISDDKGQSVYLSAAGIVINGGGHPVTITNAPKITADSPLMHCTGDIRCDGQITAGGDISDNTSGVGLQGAQASSGSSMATMRQRYDIHTHDVTNVQGGGSTIRSNPPQPQQ